MIARLALLVAAMALGPLACNSVEPAPAEDSEKTNLYLMTSLPLLFGDEFVLDVDRPPATAALEERFHIKPIDVPSDLPAGALLLAAQPRALPAEELVALDEWVRAGGTLVLLADPQLEWPTDRPMGDLLRPPIAFDDTGLLQHWGLRLDAPAKRGLATRSLGNKSIEPISPGRLAKLSGDCELSAGELVATCKFGDGLALVIADADWIDAASVNALGGDGSANLEVLVGLLLTAD